MSNKSKEITSKGMNASRIDKLKISVNVDSMDNYMMNVIGISLNILRCSGGLCAIHYSN
jgi:hypothetical protein